MSVVGVKAEIRRHAHRGCARLTDNTPRLEVHALTTRSLSGWSGVSDVTATDQPPHE